MALTVKMMSSGDVMLTYLHLTTAAAALRVSVRARTAGTPQERHAGPGKVPDKGCISSTSHLTAARRTVEVVNNRVEVREFLTTRRAKITPEQAGIPTSGQRRVPGLRRSEVAALAGMSVEYYAKLERG